MPAHQNHSRKSLVLVTLANQMSNISYTTFETYYSMHAALAESGNLQALQDISI